MAVANHQASVVYVTNNEEDAISVIDTSSNKVVATVPVNDPQGITIDLSSHTVYVSSVRDDNVYVIAPNN